MLRLLAFLIGMIVMTLPVAAEKAGVGAWEDSRFTILSWIEDTPALGWYYNWRPDQMWSKSRQPRSVEFVPMIHSAADVSKKIKSATPVTTLLGFNEPDGTGDHQADMSVEEALSLWPKLEARGLRLGSPATTQGQTLGRTSWLGRFMAQADQRGLRIDFIAVHYYSPNGDVAAFRQFLQAVHRDYRRPIWVTEFAHIDWSRPGAASHAQNADFADKAIRMMDKLPFVERHAWFAANPYPWKGGTPKINLLDANLRPTPVGKAFDRVLAQLAGDQVASRDN